MKKFLFFANLNLLLLYVPLMVGMEELLQMDEKGSHIIDISQLRAQKNAENISKKLIEVVKNHPQFDYLDVTSGSFKQTILELCVQKLEKGVEEKLFNVIEQLAEPKKRSPIDISSEKAPENEKDFYAESNNAAQKFIKKLHKRSLKELDAAKKELEIKKQQAEIEEKRHQEALAEKARENRNAFIWQLIGFAVSGGLSLATAAINASIWGSSSG